LATLVVFHREALLRKQIEALGSTGQLHLERRHGILRRSERSRQVGTKALLLLLELLLELIVLQLKLLLQIITLLLLLLLEELLHLNVNGTGHLMSGETISSDEKLLLTIATRLPGLSPGGVFLEKGRHDVHVLVELLMVLLLLLLILLRLLLLISHVAWTLVGVGGECKGRKRRRNCLAVLLTAGEAERETVGVVLMVTHVEWGVFNELILIGLIASGAGALFVIVRTK
jgi:hypothetical protein